MNRRNFLKNLGAGIIGVYMAPQVIRALNENTPEGFASTTNPTDVGLYFQKDDEWLLLSNEIFNPDISINRPIGEVYSSAVTGWKEFDVIGPTETTVELQVNGRLDIKDGFMDNALFKLIWFAKDYSGRAIGLPPSKKFDLTGYITDYGISIPYEGDITTDLTLKTTEPVITIEK